MKILSRDFTPKEKIMLLVLLLILIAVSWYRFLYIPTAEAIERANAQCDKLELQLIQAQAKEEKLQKMQEELESLGELSKASYMGSYNNAKAELTLLNKALEKAGNYTVTFSDVTRDEDQIRRKFTMEFTINSFDQAAEIIETLTKSEYRCLISEIHYGYPKSTFRTSEVGQFLVEATATFFETMYDGVPDAGLPPLEEE